LPPPDALDLLQKLTINFTGPLDVDRAQSFAPLVAWVRIQQPPPRVILTVEQRLAPALTLHGQATFMDFAFLWTLADNPTFVQEALQNDGLIVIDLDCDYILDASGRPVSGGAGAFVGSDTFAPGGIFRTWIEVFAG
jgi:hypothetical protein